MTIIYNSAKEFELGPNNLFIKTLEILKIDKAKLSKINWREVSCDRNGMREIKSPEIKMAREVLTAVSWELNRILNFRGAVKHFSEWDNELFSIFVILHSFENHH